jgi:hypothetical protein
MGYQFDRSWMNIYKAMAPAVQRMPIDSHIKLNSLRRILFVVSMNWPRMGLDAKRRWAAQLALACRTTAINCETFLETTRD